MRKPILNGVLQSDLDANGFEIINLPFGSGGDTGWITAEQYGAIANGATNNLSALQAAMDAVPSRGTLVLTGSGEYRISGGSLLRSNAQGPIRIVSFGGQYGSVTIRQMTANMDALRINVNESDVLSEQDNASAIEGIRFIGPSGNTIGAAIRTSAAIHLSRVSTYGFWNGLELDAAIGPPLTTGPYYSHIDKTMFTRAANAGVYAASYPNHNLSFNMCRFDSSAYGLYVTSFQTERFSVINSTIERNTTAGLYLDGVKTAFIGYNYFETPSSNAPDIRLGAALGCQDVTIQSDWFTNHPAAATWHIDADKVNGLNILGSTLNGSNPGGGDIRVTTNTTRINLSGTSYNTVSGLPLDRASYLFQGNGDALGNAVGIRIANTFGGILKQFGITVDNTYGKGLNFGIPGVKDAVLYLGQNSRVGVGTAAPTQSFQVGDGITFGDNIADVNSPVGALAMYSWSRAGVQKWQAYIGLADDVLRFFDTTDRMRLSPAMLELLVPLSVINTPIYANNAAAVAGGLGIGRLYRSGGDPDVVSIVH